MNTRTSMARQRQLEEENRQLRAVAEAVVALLERPEFDWPDAVSDLVNALADRLKDVEIDLWLRCAAGRNRGAGRSGRG